MYSAKDDEGSVVDKTEGEFVDVERERVTVGKEVVEGEWVEDGEVFKVTAGELAKSRHGEEEVVSFVLDCILKP